LGTGRAANSEHFDTALVAAGARTPVKQCNQKLGAIGVPKIAASGGDNFGTEP
jgi:hypothetical protein